MQTNNDNQNSGNLDALMYHYQVFNTQLDSRIQHIQQKMGALTQELYQLEQLLTLPKGTRHQLLLTCQSNFLNPTYPLKIYSVQRRQILDDPLEELETTGEGENVQQQDEQIIGTEVIERQMDADEAEIISTRVEDYIANPQMKVQQPPIEAKPNKNTQQLDLKDFLMDPEKINYSNECITNQDTSQSSSRGSSSSQDNCYGDVDLMGYLKKS